MRRSLWGVAVVAVCAAAAADDKPRPQTPRQALAALQKEVKDAFASYQQAARVAAAAKTLEEVERLQQEADRKWRDSEATWHANAVKAVELARLDPKSDVAEDALVWAWGGLIDKPELRAESLRLLREHHLGSVGLGSLCEQLSDYAARNDAGIAFLQAAAEKSPHQVVRRTAVFTLGDSYKRRAEPDGKPAPADAEALFARAEAAFESVVKDFPKFLDTHKRSLGERAAANLFEIRHLRVGKTAPDIEGEDLDGVTFKLSDYRGKVVVLDFWGDW